MAEGGGCCQPACVHAGTQTTACSLCQVVIFDSCCYCCCPQHPCEQQVYRLTTQLLWAAPKVPYRCSHFAPKATNTCTRACTYYKCRACAFSLYKHVCAAHMHTKRKPHIRVCVMHVHAVVCLHPVPFSVVIVTIRLFRYIHTYIYLCISFVCARTRVCVSGSRGRFCSWVSGAP